MSRFCVHAAPDEVARPHRVEAKSFVDAALTYAERWVAPEGPGAGGGERVTLFVQDEDSGEEHCLTLDLGSGDVSACG